MAMGADLHGGSLVIDVQSIGLVAVRCAAIRYFEAFGIGALALGRYYDFQGVCFCPVVAAWSYAMDTDSCMAYICKICGVLCGK